MSLTDVKFGNDKVLTEALLGYWETLVELAPVKSDPRQPLNVESDEDLARVAKLIMEKNKDLIENWCVGSLGDAKLLEGELMVQLGCERPFEFSRDNCANTDEAMRRANDAGRRFLIFKNLCSREGRFTPPGNARGTLYQACGYYGNKLVSETSQINWIAFLLAGMDIFDADAVNIDFWDLGIGAAPAAPRSAARTASWSFP
jgi:hypothetical protein